MPLNQDATESLWLPVGANLSLSVKLSGHNLTEQPCCGQPQPAMAHPDKTTVHRTRSQQAQLPAQLEAN
jgi:hypothetical protein